MTDDTALEAPTGLAKVLGALIQHSEDWGRLWFGLIFWGSVLFAVAQRIWPDAETPLLLGGSLAVGLAGGVAAQLRGYWV